MAIRPKAALRQAAKRFFYYFLFLNFVSLFAFFPSSAFADRLEGPLNEIKEHLPVADKGGRVILMSSNVEEYRDYLLAPVASWIEADLFRTRLFSSLSYSWSTEQARPVSAETDTEIEESTPASLEVESVLSVMPFGSYREIDEESDPSKKAQKILRNLISSTHAANYMTIDARLSWVGSKNLTKEGRVFLFRGPSSTSLFRDWIGIDEQSGQNEGSLSRPRSFELFRFTEPAAISGYSTITRRFTADNEDEVTHYSPVIAASRDLPEALRGEEIVEGLLSLDDIGVFSQRVNSVKAKVVAEKVLLLPFASLTEESTVEHPLLFSELFPAVPKDSMPQLPTLFGSHQLKGGNPSSVLWNFDVSAFPQHAPWLPLTVYMVPRKVWILELYPRNPYYPSSKQILVIDKESMLPFYKIVYDFNGEIYKTVLGAWGRAEKFMYPSFTVAVDRGARKATSMTTQRAQFISTESFESGGFSGVRKNLAELPNESSTEVGAEKSQE